MLLVLTIPLRLLSFAPKKRTMLGEQSELRCNWVATHISQKRIWELAKYYFKVHGSDIILLDQWSSYSQIFWKSCNSSRTCTSYSNTSVITINSGLIMWGYKKMLFFECLFWIFCVVYWRYMLQEWWWCWGIQLVMLMMMSVTCRKRDRRAGGESRSHKARWDAIRRLQRGVSEQIREYRREWRGRKKSDEVRIGHKGSWKSATNRRISLSLSQENWHKWHSCAKI